MTQTNQRPPLTANYDGTYRSEWPDGDMPEGDMSLSISGAISHGSVVTIKTNGAYNFGERENAKPFYVYAGDNSKVGSNAGRTIEDKFGEAAQLSSNQLYSDRFSSAVKHDFKASGSHAFGNLEFDPSKTLIIYKKILRDFDIAQSEYQNSSGGFNLKTHRVWVGQTSGPNNWYIGYQGAEGGSCRSFSENLGGGGANYYSANPAAFSWQDEIVRFDNSSVDNVDGRFRHYLDGQVRNKASGDPESGGDSLKSSMMTRNTTNPNPLKTLYFDQVSNGCGSGVEEVLAYYQFIMIDDEVRSVWLGNAATIEECTNLVPAPTVDWSNTEIKITTYDIADLSTCYLYIQTGWDKVTNERTWIRSEGLR